MDNNMNGVITQMVALGAMDASYQKTHSVSTVMSILPQQDCPEEFIFPKTADAYSKVLFVFPDQWGKWSDVSDYPLNIVKEVSMVETNTFTGEEKITPVFFTLLTKGKLLCDMAYVIVGNTELEIKLIVKNILSTTLTEPLDQLLRNVLLPLELVKIISFYGSDGIYSPPTPTTLYTLGQYYDIAQRNALLANNTLQLPPQYVPSYSPTTTHMLLERKNLPQTVQFLLNETFLYTDLKNIIVKYVCDLDILQPDRLKYDEKLEYSINSILLSDYSINNILLSVYRQFFIKKTDLEKVKKICFIVGGQVMATFHPIWLLTQSDPHNDYCVLPIPPIVNTEFHRQCIYIMKHEPSDYMINLYVKSRPVTTPINTNQTLSRFIIQPTDKFVYYNNQPQTIFQLNTNHLLCEYYIVLCYDGMPCKKLMSPMETTIKTKKKIIKTKTDEEDKTIEILTEVTTKTIKRHTNNQYIRHPFKKLTLLVNNNILSSGSGTFYNEIMPMMYNQTPNPTYMIYKIIFHPTPPISPYDYHYMNTRHTDYLTFQGKDITDDNYVHPPFNYTTLNASRIDNIELVVDWDMKAIQECFLEPNKVSLLIVEEVANIMRIQEGLAGLVFAN